MFFSVFLLNFNLNPFLFLKSNPTPSSAARASPVASSISSSFFSSFSSVLLCSSTLLRFPATAAASLRSWSVWFESLLPLIPALLSFPAPPMSSSTSSRPRILSTETSASSPSLRGALKLEHRFPNKMHGVMVDPNPNWSLDSLISELNSLEININASSTGPVFTKTKLREFPNKKGLGRSPMAFVMRVPDDDLESVESDNEVAAEGKSMAGTRFCCSELYLGDSDISEDELSVEEAPLMVQAGLLEGLLIERECEHQEVVKEEIRNRISALEMKMMNENERSTSALIQVEKHTQARRELDRKLDAQFQRKIAEELDNHLITVQRDHEYKSQMEERKIQKDAAFEEAKRREKALQEEKARQEKVRAEAEAARRREEEARKEALEAEKRNAKEIAEKQAVETAKKIEMEQRVDANIQAPKKVQDRGAESNEDEFNEVQSAGTLIKASENALKLEAERLKKYKELDEKIQPLRLGSNKDLQRLELQIVRQIKQITGTQESVRAKASELIKIMNDPRCPQSISIASFAKKVVSHFETSSTNFDGSAFACGQVIVLVTSQVPLAMDILLAELHKACIYTVPKHIAYSKSTLSKEAYHKMIGLRKEDGKIESIDRYLERVEAWMTFYGALVQTEVDGVRNLHGLNEGWAWLARLLNALPVNVFTAVALEAFLKMAGFALFKKYKSQFRKILNVISHNFVGALQAKKDPKLNRIIDKIKTYIETNQFLKEPEGWRLRSSLTSITEIPDTESGFHGDQYYRQSNRWPSQY